MNFSLSLGSEDMGIARKKQTTTTKRPQSALICGVIIFIPVRVKQDFHSMELCCFPLGGIGGGWTAAFGVCINFCLTFVLGGTFGKVLPSICSTSD